MDGNCKLFAMKSKSGHPRSRPQLDQFVRAAAVEERPVEVGAMGDGVGIAEALRETLVERDIDDFLAAHAVHHEKALDEHRLFLHQLAYAEGVDRMPGIGRELDAGADLAELARLLEDHDAEFLA